MKILFFFLLLLPFISSSLAQKIDNEWRINKNLSSIEFSGIHAGNKFNGKFKIFKGDIFFDPNKLEKSYAKILIDLSSVFTDNKTYDKTLLGEDWFDVNKSKLATFETEDIKLVADNEYLISGFLTIKNIKISYNFKAVILINLNKASLRAETIIKRLDFSLGKYSDPDSIWVSAEIPVNINLEVYK